LGIRVGRLYPSIIWYLVRVYMLKALLVAAVYGPNDQGGIV